MCDDGVLKGSYILPSCPDATEKGINYRYKNSYPKNNQTPHHANGHGRRSSDFINLVP